MTLWRILREIRSQFIIHPIHEGRIRTAIMATKMLLPCLSRFRDPVPVYTVTNCHVVDTPGPSNHDPVGTVFHGSAVAGGRTDKNKLFAFGKLFPYRQVQL